MVRLYTLHEGGHEPRAAALFIHGLDGNPHETWNVSPQSSRTFWPLWLREPFPDLAVYSIEYEASKSKWRGGHALAIEERASSLRSYLTTELKPGKRLHGQPLVLITHSMGGLIAKAMLRSLSEKQKRGPNDLLELIRGVVFIATPHAGSDLAWWAHITGAFTRPTTAVRDMMPNDPHLLRLNRWYRDNSKNYGIRSYAFYETKDTKGFDIVKGASADPAIEGLDPTPIDKNHIEIAKPLDETYPVYAETLDFLYEVLGNAEVSGNAGPRTASSGMAQVNEDDDWQERHGYRSKRENAFPTCADLNVETRQGTDQTRISATATLRCHRERLRGDDGRVFWLAAQSVSMTLHADGGDVSPSRGLGDNEAPGEFKRVRCPHNVITISKPNAPYLEGLPLDQSLLPEVHAVRDHPCSLEVQIGSFPEELDIDIISTDGDMRPLDVSELRRKLMKVVVSRALDRVYVKHERVDQVDDQLILSRVQLWPEEPR